MAVGRYHRQELLPQIGRTGQERLRAARVLLVGCGALGSVIADYLVRAGVGELRVADRDIVEWTNLQRQVLFEEADARRGVPKAVAAKGKGVITDPSEWEASLDRVQNAFAACGATKMEVVTSPIKGASGNTEFLLHAVAAS